MLESGSTILVLKIRFGQGTSMECAFAVEIDEITGLIDVVGGSEPAAGLIVGAGAFDQAVVDRVEIVIARRVTTRQASDAPVVDHVVHILNGALGLGISAV